MSPGIGVVWSAQREPAGLGSSFCGGSSASPNWSVPTNHVYVAEISCASGQEGPDSVDKREDMEVQVGHLGVGRVDMYGIEVCIQ